MKKIVTLIYLVCIVFCSNAQDVTSMYFIGAFSPMLDSTPIRTEGLNVYYEKGISFYATRNEYNYTITMSHYSYLKKATDPVVLDMPIAELDNLENVAPATELLNFENADSAYRWMVEVFSTHLKELVEYNEVRSKIFIIDTNKFYKSNPELEEPDMMKVVEVRVWPEDIPDHILNTL